MKIFTRFDLKGKAFYKALSTLGVFVFLLMCSMSFGQTAPGSVYDLSTGSWTLTGWNSGVTAGLYPTNGATGANATTGVSSSSTTSNMRFYRNGTGDPLIANSTPTADYTSAYTNSNPSIYGNGTNGLVFNGTSNNGIGSALLSVNTTGRTNIQVAWTGRTIATGARTYGIRLMYRVGTSGAFADANGTASNIFYAAAGSVGATAMPTITLPSAANNAGTVQILWYYYNEATTTSGTRPNLGLDEITVSSSSNAPTVNGTIAASEYGTHTDGSNQDTNTITWYNTWDSTNLYLGIGATSNNSTEGAVVYIDVNPIVPVNGGTNTNGTNVGNPYDRSTFNPAFRADYVVYFKSGYYEVRAANGSGGWGSAVTTGLTYAQSGSGATQSQEIAIPWSALGGSLPASFNWSAYKVYDAGASNNGVYGQIPAANPGGAQNQTAYTLNGNRYYTVSSTTSGSSTLPFSRTSYCQPIGVTTNSFGAISVYDFTVNPGSGFQVARNNAGGDWTIAGNLVVGSGTLYFGSGGSGYGASTIANVNVVGGTLNMDQTNKIMTVSGGITVASGATLTLSGTSGGDVSIAGNWSNSGTFNCSSRQVTFAGSTAQTLSGTNTFDYLKLNNAAGVTLQASSPVTVNTNLDLTSGKLTLGANNLTLLAAASATNASATGYVVTNSTGAFVKNSVGNTATAFPVGLAASYTPLTVTNTGTSNNLSLVVTSPPVNTVTDATKIVNLEWNLNSGGTGAVVTTIFNWNTGNQGASYTAAGQGELGNYTAGPNYAITSLGTMAGQTKTVSGIALSSGNNKLVIGNTGAVYATPPTNDNCSGATALTLDAAAVTGNVTNATQSLAAITCGTAGNANDDVWYSFTTAGAGTYTITVIGASGFDAVVDVRSGACTGTNIFCADATAGGGTETVSATGLTASTTYYVRVYDYNSGTPTNPTFTIAVASPPASLSTNGTTTFSFGNQAPLTQSTSQTFNLSGANLTGAPGNITVTAPNTDFQVSNNNSTWGATATIAYSSATLASTAVYVRFTPQSSGAKSGNVTFSGGGTSGNPTIALTGTGVLPAPTATAATNIAATSFDANWGAVTGASSGYLLDVSTSSTFGTSGSVLTEGFENVTFPPTGWITTGWARSTTAGDFLNGAAAAVGNSNSGTLTTSAVTNPTSMTFYLGRSSNATAKTLTIEVSTTSQTTGFTTVATYDHSNVTASTYNQYTVDLSAYSSFSTVYIRFNKSSSTTSPWRLDDVAVTGTIPSFVTGYNAKAITGQATATSNVNGLTADTTYYYRLRATDGTPSAYSNVITVNPASRGGSVASDQSICSGTQPATLTLSGNNGTVVKWQKATNTSFTGATDINVITSTLNGSDVGNLTATTYIRAVVQSFSNPTANSNYATITVIQSPTFGNLQFPASGTICQGATHTAYGQVYQAGVTEAAGAGAGITAQFGYNTSNTDPSTWSNWSNASFNVQSGNNDEYQYTFTPPSAGTFYYTFRYRQGTCNWVYGGYNGGFWNGTTNVNGALTVNATLAAGAASSTPTVCINTALTNITHSTTGATGIGTATGLPSGVTAAWASNTITISGTPTATGTFNYSIPLTGSCGSANATGTITVNPNNTVGSASSTPTLCVNTALTNITHTTTGATGIGTATGLPSGVTAGWASNTITISGTPTASGTFNYSIPLTGGCSSLNATGTITVRDASTAAVISGTNAICAGSTTNIQVALTGGVPPYTVVYSGGTVNGYTGGSNIPVAPTSTTTYTLTSVTDANGCVGSGNSGSAVISIDSTTSLNGGPWSNGSPDAGKSVIIDGASKTLSADFTACSLTVKNGAVVTIESGSDLSLSGAVMVEAGSTLTLQNNANLLQTIPAGTTYTNTGDIIVKRNSSALKRLDYTLWSSPVTGQQVYAFSPFTFGNRFYVYNTNTNVYNNAAVGMNIGGLDGNGVNGTDGNHVQFAAGKGYLIRMPWDHPTAATVWNGQFTGVPHNGDITYTMTNGGSGQRFNLVGNPYPSPITMTQFVSDNSTKITGTLYFWRETNGTTANNAYCSWAGGTFVSNNQAQVFNPNGIIRAGQGFFVEASGAATTVDFKNDQRSGDNADQFFRTGNSNATNDVEDNNRFWLNLSNTAGEFSQMAAGYMTNATNGMDIYDGRNINTGTVLLNSILDNTDYTIQGKALPFITSDVIPLSCKITNAGEYTIAIDHVDGLFTDSAQAIYLKDNSDNTFHNLQTGAYTFTSDAGTFTSRFEIVFQSQLGTENPTFTANNVVVYKQNNDFIVNSGNTIMSSIKVFDIRGRLIQHKENINASQASINGGLANGVLLVQITSEDGVVVTKKVIR